MVYTVTARHPYEHHDKGEEYLFQFHKGKYSDLSSNINDY